MTYNPSTHNGKQLVVTEHEYFERRDFPLRIIQTESAEGYPKHEVHTHEFTEITIVYSGSATHVTVDGCYPLKAGDTFIIERGRSHGYDNQCQFKIINILFNELRLPLPLWDFGNTPFAQRVFKSHRSEQLLMTLPTASLEKIKCLADVIEQERRERHSSFRFHVVGLFIELLVELERNYVDSEVFRRTDFYAIPDALEYLERNYMKNVDIARLSAIFHMSHRNFFRNFKRSTGESPYHHLLNIRLRNVHELLAKTSYPLEEIAQRCGFASSQNLAYHFRKVFNISPTQYRKSCMDGQE